MGNFKQKSLFTGGGIVFALLLVLARFGMIDLYVQSVIMFIGINIIFATSLSIVNGYMGEFSCGHAGFMAVGAYVSSILSVILFTDNKLLGGSLLPPSAAIYIFPFIILLGGVVAAFAGLIVAIPSFKTRDDYLAIITIAVNFIIVTALNNMAVVGGSRGFMGMKKVIYGMSDVVKFPYMLFWVGTFVVLTIFLIRRFFTSTYGKGIIAIKQDEVAAEIMSVDTNKMKVVAFMFSSGLAGISGGLFAHVVGYVNPSSFSILKSTEALVMVYLAGMGSLSGSVISAILFTILLEILRPFAILKWVIIPLILILVMQFRPEGLMGDKELSDFFPKLKKFYKFK